MSWSTWLWAGVICIAAAAFEALCAGRDPMGKLKALRQPVWSPPGWLWMLIGLYWYAICFVALVRLLPAWPATGAPAIVVVALLILNGLANIPLFKLRRLDLALGFFALYWPVLGLFLWLIRQQDGVTFLPFAIYAAYQIYALAWGYALWKMNPRSSSPPD